MWRLLILVALYVGYALALPTEQQADCVPCDRNECPQMEPHECAAGTTVDECGCCTICAKKEFELCDHPSAPAAEGIRHGQCGVNLECVLRQDLEASDAAQAHCQCMDQEPLCGSDGKTYSNFCQLAAAGIVTQEKITVESKGPCKQAPQIVSGPESVRERVGNSVALVCEAEGFPIPTVEWVWTRVDGNTFHLPSDDLHLAVNMRGGPEPYQVTGWLQVIEMEKKHEGDYTCIAQNEHGVQQASARLNVVDNVSATETNPFISPEEAKQMLE